MNATTESSTENTLEKASQGENPVSVYSLSFASPIITDEEREFLMSRAPVPKAEKKERQASFSKVVFNWRNAAIAGAIFTIAVLHFAFQVSFIRSEVSENRPPAEVPPVMTEPAKSQTIELKSAEFEADKVAETEPVKTLPPAARRPQYEAAPVKPQPRKKESVESPGDRLRRVEKALTGV